MLSSVAWLLPFVRRGAILQSDRDSSVLPMRVTDRVDVATWEPQ